MPHPKHAHVVTSFLSRGGKVLILKRSSRVGSFPGRWAGISGYLEGRESPLRRAYAEIEEEAGVKKRDLKLIKKGREVSIPDEESSVIWIVHPFLFELNLRRITLDWEHSEARWIEPQRISRYKTVPGLKLVLKSVIE